MRRKGTGHGEPVTGNTRGGCEEKGHGSWGTVDETPLQKRSFGEKLYK